MKVLVLNSGSSSIKYQLYDASSGASLVRGSVSRIGEPGSRLEYDARGSHYRTEAGVPNHEVGLNLVVDSLLDRGLGILGDISEIAAVGHRAVHGGAAFRGSVLIDDEVISRMEKCVPLAPLHNPPNLAGIKAAFKLLPHALQVAVFDTAFHTTMPPKAYLYALPYEYYEKHGVRRYGFHGTSYRYVMHRAGQILERPVEELKMVIAHLGNGASMAAIDGGKSIDTSMGLTPLEGLMMGTRCGDIDPGVVFHLRRELGMGVDEIDTLLNTKSGMLGISGASKDVRDIVQRAAGGDERSRLALEMFAYRAKKYIGAYAAALGGLDVVVFTGGVGERSALLRKMICSGLGFLGLEIDEQVNAETIGVEGGIDLVGSHVRVLVVPTDEERMILRDTLAVTGLVAADMRGR